MKSSLIKKTLQYVLSFALAGGLMWYVYKDVDTDALYKELKNVNMFWVGVSFIPMLISHVARARRWNLLL